MGTDPMSEDMRIVARAYREEMLAGNGDMEAYSAALEAYLARHPDKPADAAGRHVAELIFEASAWGDSWIYGRDG